MQKCVIRENFFMENVSQIYDKFLQVKALLESYPLWKVKKTFDDDKHRITWFALLPMMSEEIFSYLSSLKCAVTVQLPCLKISLSYTSPMVGQKEKASLKVKIYRFTKISGSGYVEVYGYYYSSFDIIFLENDSKKMSLFMTGRGSHYCPFSLRKFQSVYNEIDGNLRSVFDAILFGKNPSLFCKDIRKDLNRGLCGLSYDFERVIKCHNKRELLSKIFRTEISSIPRSYNKFSIVKGYGLMLLSRYIVEDQIDLIKRLPESFFQNFYKAAYVKGKAKCLLLKYYQNRLNTDVYNIDIDVYRKTIEDFFDMSVKLRRRIPLNINSMSKLTRLHDEYAGELLRKSVKGKRIKLHEKYTPLVKILQEKYRRYEVITKASRLAFEGEEQHNCVYSYLESIERGICLICSMVYDGRRFTIEIRKTRSKFKIAQFLGINNSPPPEVIMKTVRDDFIAINRELAHE